MLDLINLVILVLHGTATKEAKWFIKCYKPEHGSQALG